MCTPRAMELISTYKEDIEMNSDSTESLRTLKDYIWKLEQDQHRLREVRRTVAIVEFPTDHPMKDITNDTHIKWMKLD